VPRLRCPRTLWRWNVHCLRHDTVPSDAEGGWPHAFLGHIPTPKERTMLKRLFDASTIYHRRAQRCLEDARMAALEHETAAEYHAALGKMYRDRVLRLERGCAPEPTPSVILDASLPPRVSALRRSDLGKSQPVIAQNGLA